MLMEDKAQEQPAQAAATAAPAKEEKKSTQKAAPKVINTTPWKPSRVLDIPAHLKKPGFTYRWASKNQVGRIQKLISEGWEVDADLSKAMSTAIPKTILDGSPLDGTVQRRELIVMRIPNELAEARRAYYAQKTAGVADNNEQQLKSAGVDPNTKKSLIYGEVHSTD